MTPDEANQWAADLMTTLLGVYDRRPGAIDLARAMVTALAPDQVEPAVFALASAATALAWGAAQEFGVEPGEVILGCVRP